MAIQTPAHIHRLWILGNLNPPHISVTSLTVQTSCNMWSVKEVDEIWEKIRTATEEGKLGLASKVSTAKDSPLASSSTRKVICIYTYDWTDRKDVMRIREELRKLGITNKIPYKSDKDTLSGKYRQTGHTKISKYYE